MKKLLLFLMAIFILFLLVHSSFLQKNNNSIIQMDNMEVKNWDYSINILEWEIVYSDLNQKEDSLNIKYINHLDRILFNWEIDINNSTINLSKWIYLLNFTDLNGSYTINWPWFQVKNLWPTNIYIDTTWSKNIIFSQNNIVNLELIEQDTEKIVNKVVLYPHMYIKFNPNLNKNIVGADILKIKQWFSIDYFGEQIIKDKTINEKFLSNVTWEWEKLGIIGDMFLYLDSNENCKKEEINSIKDSSFWTVVWEKFIKWYSRIFLNDAKKVVYNKNLIIRSLWNLIKNSNTDANAEINLILDTIKEIKKLNLEDYNEMKNIIYFYSSIIVWQSYDIELKVIFSKLYNSLEWRNISEIPEYILQLNNIFQKLDFKWNILKKDRYDNMYIDLSSVNKELITKDLSENEKWYLVLFLNKIIISGFNLEVDINNIIKNFNNYINLSLQYYSSKDDVRARTWIAEYSKVLDELLWQIRNFFFKEDRNKDWLLVLDDTYTISNLEVTTLKNNINWIFSFFNNNKEKLLEKEEKLYNDNFERFKLFTSEYISALEDYKFYVANTSEKDRELLFWEEKENNIKSLKVEDAMDYLKQFSYLNLSNVNIELRDINYCEYNGEDIDLSWDSHAYCYKIENILLNNSIKLDFILIPSDYNRISNIVINWDATKNKWSYRLDEDKEMWDKLYENSSWTNSSRYDFKNYFYYTFWTNSSVNIDIEDIIEDENSIIEEIKNETSTIKAFKSMLLWKWWELNKLYWFISASYNNVLVKEIDWNYDIRIINAWIDYVDKKKSKAYSWLFSSKYIHSPKIVFENPEIIIKDNEKKDLVLWNKIKFEWEYKLKDFQKDIEAFFTNIEIIDNIARLVNNYLNITDFDIIYSSIKNNNLKIIWENFEMIIDWYLIKSIKINWKEVLSKNISSFQLEDILKTLN